MFTHGQNDTEWLNIDDADGAKDLAGYVTSNTCQASALGYDVAGCNRGEVLVNPGCVSLASSGLPLPRRAQRDAWERAAARAGGGAAEHGAGWASQSP